MSDRDYYQLREMIRKLQQKVIRLEQQIEEKETINQSHKSTQQQELTLNATQN